MEICLALFGMFLLFAFLGVPVCFSIALSSIISLMAMGDTSLVIIVQRMFSGVNSYSMQAIPFFMFAGIIMEKSGLTDRLVNFANALVGWLKGGLCYVTIVSGMFMGGVSGSASADTAALSSVLIPSMRKNKYPTGFATALVAGAGAIGIIIPPSIPMVVLGSSVNISISKMFMGGIIPGILVGLSMMVAARFISAKKHYGGTDEMKFSFTYLVQTFRQAILALVAPIIIVGGILSGFFSPTESGVVVVVYTLVLGFFVYRTLTISNLAAYCVEAIQSTANVMMIIACSSIFSWILTGQNFNTLLGNAVLSITDNTIFILLFINLVFFVGGMFLDGIPLIIMLCPVFHPIAQSVGIDSTLFGITIILNVAIGTVTPPVGSTLFVASSAAGVGIEETSKYVSPVLLSMVFVLFLVILVPELVTTLPGLTS